MSGALSEEEKETLKTYERIAFRRHTQKGDPEFWREEFEKFKTFVSSGKILDVGCGSGRDALLFLQNSNYEYTGIDLSPDMLAIAREVAPNAKFIEMSMYELCFASETFDGFWAAASFLHIPKNRLSHVLQELKRVLRMGASGCVMVKEGVGEKMIGTQGEKRFFAFYEKDEFCTSLEGNDFEILECYSDERDDQKWLIVFVCSI